MTSSLSWNQHCAQSTVCVRTHDDTTRPSLCYHHSSLLWYQYTLPKLNTNLHNRCVCAQEHRPKLSVHDQWHGVSCQDKLTVSSVNHLMIILITSPSHQHPRFLPEMSHS